MTLRKPYLEIPALTATQFAANFFHYATFPGTVSWLIAANSHAVVLDVGDVYYTVGIANFYFLGPFSDPGFSDVRTNKLSSTHATRPANKTSAEFELTETPAITSGTP